MLHCVINYVIYCEYNALYASNSLIRGLIKKEGINEPDSTWYG